MRQREWPPFGAIDGSSAIISGPGWFCRTTDAAVHRGEYPFQEGGVAVVLAGAAHEVVIGCSPGRHVRRGSRAGASGGAFYCLGDVEASQA